MKGAGESPPARLRGQELTTRIASAVALALAALGVTLWGGFPFIAFWAVASILFLGEFLGIIGYAPRIAGLAIGGGGLAASAILLFALGSLPWAVACLGAAALATAACAASPTSRWLAGAGLAYAGCVALPVMALRVEPGYGTAVTLWLFAVVWGTDVGAYLVGRLLGGPKLWPRVSPKKTWSGLVGGTVIGVIASAAVALFARPMPLPNVALVVLSAIASLAVHAGDLLESALKRWFNIKDSSHLIPGHGGIMDRLDGFAAASLIVIILLGRAI